ncbi:MAG: hypothetical protein JNJ58_00605 [Chitinophagaceae bacterium]|nr:hypothetical protein [Chitinophagaceae bacterium]
MSRKFILVAILVGFMTIDLYAQEKINALPSYGDVKILGDICEAVSGMQVNMPSQIKSSDTNLSGKIQGQKILISGTVYQQDRMSPAAEVILYYWIEDETTPYRGWIKTDPEGHYSIFTHRPRHTKHLKIPAAIHLAVQEPDPLISYCLDDLIFEDDVYLSSDYRKHLKNIGGSGLLKVIIPGDIQFIHHDVILGLNVKNYPAKEKKVIRSGLDIGEFNPSFLPFHAWGPDAGTRTCMTCSYGRFHGIIYFVGEHVDWTEIKSWLSFLEQQSLQRGQYLKVFFVWGQSAGYDATARQLDLERIGKELGIQKLALTYVPSFTDHESEMDQSKINPSVDNTLLVLLDGSIIDKFIDLKPNAENFKLISGVLDKTKRDEFDLVVPVR